MFIKGIKFHNLGQRDKLTEMTILENTIIKKYMQANTKLQNRKDQ